MSASSTVLNPGRRAHASIQEYLYQAYLGVERWLELKQDEVLCCAGDENVDQLLRDGSNRWTEQVKSLNGVNLRDLIARETLRYFTVLYYKLRTASPPDPRRLVFTLCASRRPKHINDPFLTNVLAAWEEAKTNDALRARVKVLRMLLARDKADDPLRSALSWLDGDDSRWADFIRSVEWQFGEPQLTEVRGTIKRKIIGLLPGAPPGLDHRLLAELLDASVAPEPQDRCRTRRDLQNILKTAEVEVSRWLTTARGQNILVEHLKELDNLRGVLFDKPLALPSSPRPSQLLTAAYEVIPFDQAGQEEVLEDLARWCAGRRKRLVRLIYGDSGTGKTRLLIEWCRRLSALGWITGFLEPTATLEELGHLLQGKLPRLVVIDYAERRLDATRFLVHRLARAKGGPRLRLVLLARREGDWWQSLLTDSATEDLLESTYPHELPQLMGDLEERRMAFQTAVRTFSHYLMKAPLSPVPEPDLTEEAFGRPLYLHMAALAAAQGHMVAGAQEALVRTLQRERHYWRELIQSLEDEFLLELEEALSTAVTALTLLGGLETRAKTQELVLRLLPGSGTANARVLAKLLHRLYSSPAGAGRYVGGLEPDLLGEELIWEVLRQDRFALHIALDLADPMGQRQILTVLTRLAQRPERVAEAQAWLKEALEAKLDDLAEPALEVAVAQGDPVGELLAQVIQERASPELATRIMDRCDERDLWLSVPLREVAYQATQLVYVQLRKLREENATEANTEEASAEFTRVSLNLGMRLSALGRREEALQATLEAVEVSRLLAQQRPDQFRPALATSLNNLGNRLSALGRHEEALQATQEAAALCRLLAQQRPDMFTSDLATSLNNLGTMLSEVGRREEALQATQEAAEIYRGLAQQHPDVFRPDLATSLNNLGRMLSDVGRHEEALQATQEAAEIYRLLAEQRPDEFSPYLALSLNNLGLMLGALDRREEALQATQEAVELYRLLTQQRPGCLRPDLASSLGNLSSRLSEAGRRREALAAAEEGVRMLAPYFLRYPRAFEGWMARNMRNYLLRCNEMGYEPEKELVSLLEGARALLRKEQAEVQE